MRTGSAAAALLLSVLLAIMPVPGEAAGPEVGEPAPGWKLRDSAGVSVRFPRDVGDGPAVVLFWASWCHYCKALMAGLAALQEELGSGRLPVFAIRLEEAGGSAPELPDGFRSFDGGWDAADAYGVTLVPSLFLVRDGTVTYRLDYPPPDHPSQEVEHGPSQARMLGPWWEARLRGVLATDGFR